MTRPREQQKEAENPVAVARPVSEYEDEDVEFTWFEMFETMAAKSETFSEDRPE